MKDNKLIADFLGVIIMETNCCSCGEDLPIGTNIQYTTSGYDTYCDNTTCTEGIATIGTCLEECWWNPDDDVWKGYRPEDLKYHESWDWLMPVIVKMADIRQDKHYKLYKSIDKAYQEVVEFIYAYNQNK